MAPAEFKKGLLPFGGSPKVYSDFKTWSSGPGPPDPDIYSLRRYTMKNEEELVLKVTKEIVVKFIEMGRLSVNSFGDVWKQIHQTVRESLKDDRG